MACVCGLGPKVEIFYKAGCDLKVLFESLLLKIKDIETISLFCIAVTKLTIFGKSTCCHSATTYSK